MATAADFAQFSDSPVILEIGEDIDHEFERSIDTPVSGEGCVLTWNGRRQGTGSVTYEVRVNGALINTYVLTLADVSTVQEAMSTSSIHAGGNSVEFKVTLGTGILAVSDVILWYRKTV